MEAQLGQVSSLSLTDDADVMEHRFVSQTTDFIRQWITGTSDVEAR